MVVSEMGEQWSPHTAPARPAERYGELYFEDPFSKQLPLGIYYRFTR